MPVIDFGIHTLSISPADYYAVPAIPGIASDGDRIAPMTINWRQSIDRKSSIHIVCIDISERQLTQSINLQIL